MKCEKCKKIIDEPLTNISVTRFPNILIKNAIKEKA